MTSSAPRVAGLFYWLFAVFWLCLSPASALTERIVSDPNTGLAIYGIDPVAYFTDGEKRTGNRDFEADFGGLTWRFVNGGNQAAFLANPDVYGPKFGGYDPIGLTQGRAVAGNPDLWLIYRQRLFFFFSRENLEAFKTDPAGQFGMADGAWPRVKRDLVQ